MSHEELLARVTVDPAVCAGKPCIRGTRIYIAIILDDEWRRTAICSVIITSDILASEVRVVCGQVDVDDRRDAEVEFL